MNDAIADFTRVLDADPNHVNAAYARAACYNSKGQFSKAIEDYNIALMKDQEKAESGGRVAGTAGGKSGHGGVSTPVSAHKRQGSMVVGAAAYARQREEALRIQMGPRMASPPPGSTPTAGLHESFFSSEVGVPKLETQDVVTAVPPTITIFPRQQLPQSLRTAFTSTNNDDDDGEYASAARDMGYEDSTGSPNPEPVTIVSSSRRAADRPKAEGPTGFNKSAVSRGKAERMPSARRRRGSSSTNGKDSVGGPKQSASPTKRNDHASEFLATTSENSAALVKADEHHTRGFALRKNNDFKGAVEEYTKAIRTNPSHFKAYFNRGFAWDKLRQFDKAIQDYTTALQLDPNNAYAYYNRGISRDRASNFEEAIEDFSQAIRLMPGNSDFYHNRGFCYRKQGNFESAIADYTEALQCDPQHYKVITTAMISSLLFCYPLVQIHRLHPLN